MKENDNEIAIKVDHVYKSFNIYYDRANTLKERMLFFARNKRREKREVLKDINLEIKKGETVALIGVNGSGKSTLLKLMTQIIFPNKGTIETKGKLTSLLEKLDLTVNKTSSTMQGKVGLGTSNILSMACELLLNDDDMTPAKSSFLLIEEPEAHIHAQRQLKLIQSLELDSEKRGRQIIITTHSPLLASVVRLENITLMKDGQAFSMSKGLTLLGVDDYTFLEKYLDATKANLFFAKSVLIVEGPGEALLLPTIAKLMGFSFIDYGVSLVDVRGVGLRRYAKIFQRAKEGEILNVKVACVTDRDIMPMCAPAICLEEEYCDSEKWPDINSRKWRVEEDFTEEEMTEYISNIKKRADGQNVKTFVSDYWTLEYDLAFVGFGNKEMKKVLICALAKTLQGG